MSTTIEERMNEYNLHKEAGYNFYNLLRSQLSFELEGGIKSESAVLDIQKKVEAVKNELIWGDWKNALIKINEVAANENLTDTFIGQIRTSIEDYINNNYSW